LVKRVKHKFLRYRCGARNRHPALADIQVAQLDSAVWQVVTQLLTDPASIAQHLERTVDRDPVADDLIALDRRLDAIKADQGNWLNSLAKTYDDTVQAMILEKLSAVAPQIKQMETERAGLIARRAEWEAAQHQAADLIAWCQAVADKLPQELNRLDYQARRNLLDVLRVSVTLRKGGKDPDYVISVDLPGSGAPTVYSSGRTMRR
jgi:hypothetical protein